MIANVCFLGEPGGDWVLVDAGVWNSEEAILGTARARFGADRAPKAILLTHGHFDHIGALDELLERWDVPVYAHPLEIPYLTGQADYPPPDPTVGGGLMAWLSPLYPRRGVNLGDRVRPLPEDGSVPGAPGWRWIHTPGHTPGHVSFFRDADRVLVAGDAFTTVQQESALAVALQEKEIHGPPAYFTTDWKAAEASVQQLESLHPSAVVTGHGRPMEGKELSEALEELVEHFQEIAVPDHGRYVPEEPRTQL